MASSFSSSVRWGARVFTVLSVAALAACGGGSGGNNGGGTPAAAPQFKFTVTDTQDFASAQTFGSVGAYEQLTGTFYGELDPKDPRNAVIQDIELAPLNARGLVEYSTEFIMLKPKDMSKASGVLRYDAPNRGNMLTMPNLTNNPSESEFFERGYVWLFAAWQGDVPKSSPTRLTATVPVAKNPDGSSVTGTYRTELVPGSAVPVMSLPGGVFNGTMIPYEPVSLDNTQPGYSLTKRINETDSRIAVNPSDWKFADCDAGSNPFPGTPDGSKICLKGGFDPNYLYELVYEAKDPKVMGVGLAALRDFISFLRLDAADADGTANPLAEQIKNTLGQGTSQCGNAMKTFLHLGFNERLDGGKVFDGIYSHVAARQTNINARFAVPGGGGGLRTDHTAFGQTAPRGLAADYYDGVSGRTGGVMKRCSASDTCPKFFLGLSGTEYWQLQGSPVLTDAFGFTDLTQPDNVRIYYYSSTQHGDSSNGKRVAVNAFNPARAIYPASTEAGFADTFRALFINLEDWVVNNVAPPDNQVPRIDNATLVRPQDLVFPAIKGVVWFDGRPIPDFEYKAWFNGFKLFDFGPRFIPQDDGGIADFLPPHYMERDYAIMVPQVSTTDGMTLAGIKSVTAAAPTGTSLEFNYVSNPLFIDTLNLGGAFIPFHKTEAARLAAGDTRPSLESLYVNQAGYVAAITAAANDLVSRRFLLQRDADRAIQYAVDNPVLP